MTFSESGEVDAPVDHQQKSGAVGEKGRSPLRECTYPVFQGDEQPLHAKGDQYTPEKGVFQADISPEMEPVGNVCP